jgi:hypothetical protein
VWLFALAQCLWLDNSSSYFAFNFYLRCAGLITCKIIRFRCSGKCQCNRKAIKVFGKIVFAFHSSESKGVGRILFLIFFYYSSNSESTVPHIYYSHRERPHLTSLLPREAPLGLAVTSFPIARVLVINPYTMKRLSSGGRWWEGGIFSGVLGVLEEGLNFAEMEYPRV